MNKNIETKQIKVNNFSEMFAEMRKLKNSGGEWKLLGRHSMWTIGDGMTDYSKKVFIISNGTEKVDIVYELECSWPRFGYGFKSRTKGGITGNIWYALFLSQD